MSYGVFVDIRQQDGSLVRMSYKLTPENCRFCEWVGINEQMADRFKLKDATPVD